MTASLLAVLVKEGTLQWDVTQEQAFPHFADDMHPELRGVTLKHLTRDFIGF